jgi:hypothetical protein
MTEKNQLIFFIIGGLFVWGLFAWGVLSEGN